MTERRIKHRHHTFRVEACVVSLFHLMLLLAITAMSVAFLSQPAFAEPPAFNPTEIAVDGSGNVYAILGSGSAEAGIHVYAPDGREQMWIRGDEYTDLATADNGSFYLSNIRKSYVERVMANGSYDIIWREERPGWFIDYLALDRNGTLLVSDFKIPDQFDSAASGCIWKIGPGGTVTGMINNSTEVPMDRPFKFSVSPNGTIYLVASGRYVMAIYPDGGRNRIFISETGSDSSNQLIDVAADGNYIYVTEASRGSVYKLADNGSVMAGWDGCGPDRFATPFGVATDGRGRVYVSDMQNQRVVWLDGDRYRFGNDTAENVAGKGDLWDTVVSAGSMPARPPMHEGVPVESMPGYSAVVTIAALCLAGGCLCLRRAGRD